MTGGWKLTDSAVCEYPTTVRSHTESPQLPALIVTVELHGSDVPSYDVNPPTVFTDMVNAPTAVEARDAVPATHHNERPHTRASRYCAVVSGSGFAGAHASQDHYSTSIAT